MGSLGAAIVYWSLWKLLGFTLVYLGPVGSTNDNLCILYHSEVFHSAFSSKRNSIVKFQQLLVQHVEEFLRLRPCGEYVSHREYHTSVLYLLPSLFLLLLSDLHAEGDRWSFV